MKRDMDLLRQILVQVEDHPFDMGMVELRFDGRSKAEIAYHVKLAQQAGLVEAIDLSTSNGPDIRPTSLTWHGHEFLEAARDETRWKKAKSIMKKKGGGMAFEVLQKLLTELMLNNVLPV